MMTRVVDPYLSVSDLTAGSSATRRLRQFASARHRIDSTRDLRIGVVENLRRNSITVSRRQHVVTQLPLSVGARLLELIRRHFEDRLVRGELLQLLEQSVGNRIIVDHEIVL